MKRYVIENPESAWVFGEYEAEDRGGALRALREDAGYTTAQAGEEEDDVLLVTEVAPDSPEIECGGSYEIRGEMAYRREE